MPTPTRVRNEMDVQRTALDKGLTMTIRVTVYDSGVVQVNGNPAKGGLLGVSMLMQHHLLEFNRQYLNNQLEI